ncbi:MAG: TorF family putative porin [Azoarcus sp.]|jgi:uncharacterized protein (TIGR02001 family)|nr:TorF family putative porin [Azoarcus sp.]
MRKLILASAVIAALPLVSAAEESSPFSANVSITSDYAYRGISQTDEKPALQGGFDFKHGSGLYVGVWGSSISWLRDAETFESSGNSVELDLYAGYSKSFGDAGVDVGVLHYGYPGKFGSRWRDDTRLKNDTGLKNPNTTEGYVGVSWKFVSFKYSHAFTHLFGTPDSKGSDYFDLSLSHDVIENLTLAAHVGKQRVFGPGESYIDWKLGATYKLAGFDFGLHYVNTDIDHVDEADDRVIFSIGRSF